MFKTLSPGAIGVKVQTLEQGIAAAKTGGFDGREIDVERVAEAVERDGPGAVNGAFAAAGVRAAAFPLPVEWRASEAQWRDDLAKLPRLAQAATAVGVSRTFTWVMPCSNERAWEPNRAFHVERFQPIAHVLADHGVHLGLEFIGPKTLRESQTHPFIHTMDDMLAMARDIGPNVGLLLDCWHWYTSRGTVEQIRALRALDVVYVHVNDAPRNVEIDQQIDNVRALPGATGVIDIAGFLQALKTIAYDGPVTPEPFSKDFLAGLPSDEARLKTVGAAMDDVFAKAGI